MSTKLAKEVQISKNNIVELIIDLRKNLIAEEFQELQDAINDKKLPKIDALILGGGFPELSAYKLSKNKSMLKNIYDFIESNGPVYAECGGLMYLTKKISYQSKEYPMVGIIDGYTKMYSKPIGRGYVSLETTRNHPWLARSLQINCHEFHHSRLYIKNSKHISKSFHITEHIINIIILYNSYNVLFPFYLQR